MKNNYEIRGEVTAIFVESPKYGHKEILISTNKLAMISELKGTWHVQKDSRSENFYARMSINREGERSALEMHRLLTHAPKGMQVDHINHKTLDNTDDNLRVCTTSENQQNRKGANIGTKSGIRGVAWDKRKKKWTCQFRINKKMVIIGRFTDIKDAERAATSARIKYMPFSNGA